MVKVFVPGPSVGGNLFGNPAQYINNIGNIANSRRRERVANQRTENEKLFRDATLAMNERKQDYVEAEPQRAEELRLSNLAIDNAKTKSVQDLAEGAQFAGGDRFDTIRSTLMKDPRFAKMDESGQLAAQNEYIKNNPTSLTSPKRFGEILRAGLVQDGKFTGAEINDIVSKQIARRYPTGDADLVEAQLLKPKDFGSGSGTNISIGADGKIFSGRSGGSGSFNFVSDPVNQGDKTSQMNDEFELLGLTDKSTKSTLGISHELAAVNPINPFGNFDFNVTQQGYSKAISKLEGAGLSVSEAIGVLRDEIDGDLESNLDFENLKPGDVTRLADKAAGIKAQQTQLLNKKGGDISAAGQAAGGRIFTPAQAANAAAVHNQRLLSTLTPQADSDSEVITSFLNRLGPATNTTRQGSDQGGGTPTPEVPLVTPGIATPPPVVEETPAFPPLSAAEGPPGRDTRVFNNDQPIVPIEDIKSPVLQQQLSEAQERISIFGNGTPSDKALIKQTNSELKRRQDDTRVAEIEAELREMPRPDQRTLAQTAYARSLEKELRDLK